VAACFAYPLPVRFAFPNPSNGGLSLVGDSAEALTRTHWSDVCRSTHLQTRKILAVTLETPDGQRFAEVGMGTC
jgi:hypothetical protein